MTAPTLAKPLSPLLLLPLLLLLLGAAPSRGEQKAWRGVTNARDSGNSTRLLDKAEAFLSAHPGSDFTLEAELLAGFAAFDEERWSASRGHLEAWLSGGGKGDLDEVRFRVAWCLSKEGRPRDAIPSLKNVAKSDPNKARAARATRELVGIHSFAGNWKDALKSLAYLFELEQFDPVSDLAQARRFAEKLAPILLADGAENAPDPLLAGLLSFLLLDQDGQLLDSPDTEDARRDYADRFPDHPLLAKVPGGVDFATEPEDTDPGKIGVLLPLSGKFAAPGALALRGVELALAQAKERGLEGVELVLMDTKSDPKKAEEGLRALTLEHKVIAVVGPMIVAEAEQLTASVDELRVPVMMLVQRPGMSAGHPSLFNNWVLAEEQVDAVVLHAMSRLHLTKFAIIYPGSEGGARMADRFWTKVEENGGSVVAVEGYDLTQTDFRETARRLKGSYYVTTPPGELDLQLPFLPDRSKPQIQDVQLELVPGVDFEAIFVPDNFKRVSLAAPGMLFEEINLGGHLSEEDFPKVTLLGGAALNHPDFVKRGGKYIEGSIIIDGFFNRSPEAAVKDFVEGYRATYDKDPSILEAVSYDSTTFLLQLLAEGIDSRRDMKRRLRLATPARAITGARGFDNDGEMRHDMLTLTVHDGAIEQIWPPPPVELLDPEGAGEPATGDAEESPAER